MTRYALILLFLLPTFALAENFQGYRNTTLDSVVDQWNRRTKSEGPGFSFSRPEKIKFVAATRDAPASCPAKSLETALNMMGFAELLKQVSVTHCITLASSAGRPVVAFVQDALVPGLKADVRIGQPVEIYADFLAYQVATDRTRNTPILLVNRFEPR